MSKETGVRTIVAGALLGAFFVTGCATQRPEVKSSGLDGLLLHYSFDKAKGEAVTDTSGSGHNGIFRGDIDGACEFGNGVSIDTKPLVASQAAFNELTLSAWIKTPEPTKDQLIVGRTTGKTACQTPGSFGLWLREGNPGFYFNDGFKDRRLSFATAIDKDKWYHLTAVLNKTGVVEGYVNGMRVFSSSESGFCSVPVLECAFFRVGRWEDGNQYAYSVTGLLDDVSIYRKALTESQVKKMYEDQRVGK